MLNLQNLDANLWVIDHVLPILGVNLGTRTTLLRLAEHVLCLISPGPGLDTLSSEIQALGEVHYILAPNTMHHLSLAATQGLFPQAQIFGPPGLKAKQPNVSYQGFENAPWQEQLEVYAVQGFASLQEHVFFHAASKTLIATDLVFHFRSAPDLWSRTLMKLNGCYQHFGPSRVLRSLIKDRSALRQSLEYILLWDFERVIMAHGEVLSHGGKTQLKKAYQRIGILPS